MNPQAMTPRRSRQLATRTLTALCVAMALRAWWVWDQLPPRMASHFDAYGRPNGFQSRETFFVMMFGVQALLLLCFLAPVWLLRVVPPRWINLPNRDYWLAPERIDDTRDRLASWTLWFGAATLVLTGAIFELVLRANLTRSPMHPMFTWVFVFAFTAFTPAALITLYRTFRVKS